MKEIEVFHVLFTCAEWFEGNEYLSIICFVLEMYYKCHLRVEFDPGKAATKSPGNLLKSFHKIMSEV
jgi:hypothetical protein